VLNHTATTCSMVRNATSRLLRLLGCSRCSRAATGASAGGRTFSGVLGRSAQAPSQDGWLGDLAGWERPEPQWLLPSCRHGDHAGACRPTLRLKDACWPEPHDTEGRNEKGPENGMPAGPFPRSAGYPVRSCCPLRIARRSEAIGILPDCQRLEYRLPCTSPSHPQGRRF
jgi:hypothetical protein